MPTQFLTFWPKSSMWADSSRNSSMKSFEWRSLWLPWSSRWPAGTWPAVQEPCPWLLQGTEALPIWERTSMKSSKSVEKKKSSSGGRMRSGRDRKRWGSCMLKRSYRRQTFFEVSCKRRNWKKTVSGPVSQRIVHNSSSCTRFNWWSKGMLTTWQTAFSTTIAYCAQYSSSTQVASTPPTLITSSRTTPSATRACISLNSSRCWRTSNYFS